MSDKGDQRASCERQGLRPTKKLNLAEIRRRGTTRNHAKRIEQRRRVSGRTPGTTSPNCFTQPASPMSLLSSLFPEGIAKRNRASATRKPAVLSVIPRLIGLCRISPGSYSHVRASCSIYIIETLDSLLFPEHGSLVAPVRFISTYKRTEKVVTSARRLRGSQINSASFASSK